MAPPDFPESSAPASSSGRLALARLRLMRATQEYELALAETTPATRVPGVSIEGEERVCVMVKRGARASLIRIPPDDDDDVGVDALTISVCTVDEEYRAPQWVEVEFIAPPGTFDNLRVEEEEFRSYPRNPPDKP